MPGGSEFALIDRYFTRPTPSALLGPGDDAALLQPAPGMQLAVTTDLLVAGTHFFPGTDPENLGWKTLAVNLSDLAAMGALPRWALLAGSLPEADESWIAAFARGFFACAAQYAVDLIGGDTTRGPLALCVTALGEVPRNAALRRDGARQGDDIWVSGHPGLAALGLALRQAEERPGEGIGKPPRLSLSDPWRRCCLAALEKPRPRVELGQALRGFASAAIDVSDGLLADLGHIARRSGLAAAVHLTRLPHLPQGTPEYPIPRARALDAQLAGGDDYELCFTAPARHRPAIGKIAADLDLPLWRIGEMHPGEPGVTVFDPDGAPVTIERHGFEHFGTPPVL